MVKPPWHTSRTTDRRHGFFGQGLEQLS